jgi:fibronectin-binding autotransporter adhesin
MRKATFAALVGATALVVSAKYVSADTLLFGTQADFGGSQYAPGGSEPLPSPYRTVVNPNPIPNGQIQQTNWLGIGYYDSDTSGGSGGTISPIDSLGDSITYASTSLGNVNITSNGLANFDNYNPASGTTHTPDANLGTSYAGLTSPTGSLVINDYTGGYDIMTTGEMIANNANSATESTASQAFINALTSGTCLAYDITAPGGGTTGNTTYFESTFETYDSNGGFNTSGYMQVNPSATELGSTNNPMTAPFYGKNNNEYGSGSNLTIGNDDPGSFSVVHGSGASAYWTVYLPYSFAANYAATLTYLQFALELNGGGDLQGNVTIDNIRTVSPTWAAAGTGLSWNQAGVVNYNESAPNGTPSNGVLTQAPNWVGGPGGYGVPSGSGVGVTFGDLETMNASVGLDAPQTVGTLNFNTLQWQYTLVPSSTGSSTAGYLIMDNTVNNAPAAINEIAGGTAATNYTENIEVPVQLNSTTNVTVTRSTDVLNITGNISGSGGLTMSGAGTLQLSGSNTYTGGTSVSSGTVLVTTGAALPKGALTITGGLVQLANGATAGSQSADPPVTAPSSSVNLTSLSISGTGQLDIGNNHIIIDYSSPATDPIASIESMIKSGFNGGSWTGSGIISSDAAANSGSYGIGYADAADPGDPAGLASGEIEIAYTLLGDANLDGKVNGADFTIMATNFNQGDKVWDQGDFNYDGNVNGADFTLLAKNFNQSASQSDVAADDLEALDSFAAANGINLNAATTPDVPVVPEPASLGLLTLGLVSTLAHRRRRGK